MIKKLLHISLLILIIVIVSCSKSFLNLSPENAVTTSNFFNTEIQFQQALTGAYAVLRSSHGSVSAWAMGEMRSDNTHYDLNAQNRGVLPLERENIADFVDVPENSTMTSKWNADYAGISKVNAIIDRLPKAAFADSLKNPIMAEAKLLRALWYFDLVQFYGRVPLHISEVTNEIEASLPRSSVDDVYRQIIADINDAMPNLAIANVFPQTGRVTQGAAKCLLGNVYMVLKQFDLAEKTFKEVTQMNYQLLPDYASVFIPANKNSRESILEVQYLSTANLGQQSNFIYYFLPVATGLSIITGASPNSANADAGWNIPTENLLNSYEPDDKRLDASVGIVEGTLTGTNFTPSGLKSIVGYTTPTGKVSRRFIKKYLHSHSVTGSTDENFYIYRYAGVLLSLAEALNEQNKSTEALPYLNQVRIRAGLPPATETGQAALRLIIEKERRIELAFENHRWLDLVRTGRAVEVMTAYGVELKTLFPNLAPNTYTITPTRLLFPIPRAELDRNVKIMGDQNPGY
ncbi:MAG: RagB/SusD family nutrient uptake outer membrane protein [Niabella sp.]